MGRRPEPKDLTKDLQVTSHVIGGNANKTRYFCTPSGRMKIQDSDNTWSWRGRRALGTLIHCWWECEMAQPPWKAVPYTEHTLAYDPAISLLWVYPERGKTHVGTKTCLWIFGASLFIIAKTWKQSRCRSVGGWVKKPWYVGRCNISPC